MAGECTSCSGRGYILTTKVKEGMVYDYGWRCFCDLGKRYPAWPEIPYNLAPEKPLGDVVQMEIPKEWEEAK